MHYLYVGYYVDDKTFTEILDRKINNMSVARQKFEYNIIRGFHEQLGDDVSFVSYVPTDGKDLATIIANIVGKEVVFEIPDAVEAAGYSTATKARLDGHKLQALGWAPRYDIRSGMERTIKIVKDINS